MKAMNLDVEVWGLDLAINLQNCDKGVIQSKEELSKYVVQLCNLIDMKRVGEPEITYMAPTPALAGFTVVQLIQTSSIVIHLCDEPGAAYFNIFSCKLFDTDKATEFTMQYFKTKVGVATALYRGPDINLPKQVC